MAKNSLQVCFVPRSIVQDDATLCDLSDGCVPKFVFVFLGISLGETPLTILIPHLYVNPKKRKVMVTSQWNQHSSRWNINVTHPLPVLLGTTRLLKLATMFWTRCNPLKQVFGCHYSHC